MDTERVLLAVLAHPDDESFGPGGTLALYAQQGVNVHLVCATRGEAGHVSAEMMEGFASIAEKRTAELRCAAQILGLRGVHYLDYRDSGMPGSPDNLHPQALAAAPLEEAAGKIAAHIRRLHPQVVITFDPIGGYKHPDHIAVHRATMRAFELAADPNFADLEGLPPFQAQKLYFNVFSKTSLKLAIRLLPLIGRDPRRFGRNGDIDLVDIAVSGSFPVHAVVNYRSVRDRRDAAAACHASQLGGGPPRRGIVGWIWNLLGGKDEFMRAYPKDPPRRRERDLFAGIDPALRP